MVILKGAEWINILFQLCCPFPPFIALWSNQNVWMHIWYICVYLRNWYFWTVLLEKTLESPLESKAIKAVNLKGNQPWILFGRTDTKAEAPKLWPPDMNRWLIGKDPYVGKDWRQEEKRVTEGEMVGWHHLLSGHELGQILGNDEGQGSLAGCSPQGRKELVMT